jgi:DNA-binding NarL/FixJ family response regulator
MQQSLRAALAAYPWLHVVASAGDGLNALNQVVRHHPGLLVIDCNLLDEEVEALLAGVKAKTPETRCLVFIRSNQRAKPLLAAGAAGVIMRDSSAQQLQTALMRLV